MDLSLAYFKEIASVIKDLVFALGLLIGGVWAYLKFKRLNTYKESTLKIRELEEKLKSQPIIRVNIDIESICIENNQLVIGEAIIINTGNRNTNLDFEKTICKATEIRTNESIEEMDGEKFPGYISMYDYVLRAGNQVTVPFIIKIDSKKLFRIDFWVEVPLVDRDIYSELNIADKDEKRYFGTQKFLKID